jgi:hypothetical protein
MFCLIGAVESLEPARTVPRCAPGLLISIKARKLVLLHAVMAAAEPVAVNQ